AGRSLDRLCEQAARWRPAHLALEEAADAGAARERLRAAAPGADVEVGPGAGARLAVRCGAPLVVNGIVGAAGRAASLAALECGARLALANKETLVIGAPLVAEALRRGAAARGGDARVPAAERAQAVASGERAPSEARAALASSALV